MAAGSIPVGVTEVDVQAAVAVYLDERARLGEARYGTRLKTGNGRDGLRDLMEELADGLQYVAALIIERDGKLPPGDAPRQALPQGTTRAGPP